MVGAARFITVAFFSVATLITATSLAALLFPSTALSAIWRLRPAAHQSFNAMGPWGLLLLFSVGVLCAVAALGLWMQRRWGVYAALFVLCANMVGDIVSTGFRGDFRALLGLPVALALAALVIISTTAASRRSR
jgi:hypothetical protein